MQSKQVTQRFLFTVLLLSLAMHGGSLNAQDRDQAHPMNIQASFDFAKTSFLLGEPIIGTFRMQNKSSEALHFCIGVREKDGFRFVAREAAGVACSPLSPYAEGGGEVPIEVLAPAETYQKEVVVNRFVVFDKTGEYVVDWAINLNTFSKDLKGKLKFAHRVLPFNGRVKLQIDKGDPEQLEKIYSDLVGRIVHNSEWMERAKAMQQLTSIRSPIALQYVQKLITEDKDNTVRWYGIRGLRENGTEMAVDVLLKSLKSGDVELKKLILPELHVITSEKAMMGIIEALDDQNPVIRVEALKIIGWTCSKKWTPYVEKKISDPDRNVQDQAKETLKSLRNL